MSRVAPGHHRRSGRDLISRIKIKAVFAKRLQYDYMVVDLQTVRTAEAVRDFGWRYRRTNVQRG